MADNIEEVEKESFESLTPLSCREGYAEQGERFSYFRNILMKSTERCFAPARAAIDQQKEQGICFLRAIISWLEKISSCLSDVKKKNPEAFDSIIQQLVDSLQVNVKQELDLMIKQENLVSLCHELDEITQEAKEETKTAWRPSGKPCEDIKDHIMHTKIEFREKLKEKLNQLQNENKAMQENITLMRKEVIDTEERITKKHQQLEKLAQSSDNLANGNSNKDGEGSQKSLERMIVDLQG